MAQKQKLGLVMWQGSTVVVFDFCLFLSRCYACDDEVPVEPESALHKCIKLLLKAMNLSPPPGNSN